MFLSFYGGGSKKVLNEILSPSQFPCSWSLGFGLWSLGTCELIFLLEAIVNLHSLGLESNTPRGGEASRNPPPSRIDTFESSYFGITVNPPADSISNMRLPSS